MVEALTNLRGFDTFSRAKLSTLFFLRVEMGFTLKGKNLLPRDLYRPRFRTELVYGKANANKKLLKLSPYHKKSKDFYL